MVDEASPRRRAAAATGKRVMHGPPRHKDEHHHFAVGSVWSDRGSGDRWVIVDVVHYRHEKLNRHDICLKPYERVVFRPWRTKWSIDYTVLAHMEYEGHDDAFDPTMRHEGAFEEPQEFNR